MKRFFIDEKNINKDKVTIKGAQAHHIKDVIRLKPGDRFIGLDGKNRTYTLRIVNAGKDIMACIEKVTVKKTDSPRMLLACAIPKKNKMDYIVEKATELGASCIIPMITERTIVRNDAKSNIKKQQRWQKIAIEASKQSGRTGFPKINSIVDFLRALEIIEKLEYSGKIIPFVGEGLKHISNLQYKESKDTAVLIGPEGDFTRGEVGIAERHGFLPVSLGPLVLRVDTACFFVLSVISSKFHE